MPRIIDVKLQQITCSANGFGGVVEVSGDVFGETFQSNPNDPANSTGKLDIFPFPNGPVGLTKGQTVQVTMESVRFDLFAEGQEPPAANPHFLTIGGTLNPGLGSRFFTIPFDEPLPFLPQPGDTENVPPRQFNLEYSSPNATVTLTFGLAVAQVF